MTVARALEVVAGVAVVALAAIVVEVIVDRCANTCKSSLLSCACKAMDANVDVVFLIMDTV